MSSDAQRAAQIRYNISPKGKYRDYHKRSQRHNLKWSLTYQQFLTFWKKPCHYCGHPIYTIGLDRVDNKKGYELGNLYPCCRYCNTGKNVETEEQYIRRCLQVAYRHGLKRGWTIIGPSGRTWEQDHTGHNP